ncbi:MAG: hypothetical protein IT385_03675 [Deltaproteobacteria bacterium]|nr:hypothetical protein [Deltaproteobacteria bacterium]
MDDTRQAERGAGERRESESGPTLTEQDASFEVQARHACEAAARRYQAVREALEAIEARGASEPEEVRHLEEARLHVEAARLAWFNTVVHYERVQARRRAALLT